MVHYFFLDGQAFYRALLLALYKQGTVGKHTVQAAGPLVWGAALWNATCFAKESTPSGLFVFCPSARVPANPLPTLLYIHRPSSRAVTTLSGPGDVCGWKPLWAHERSLDSLQDGRRQSTSTWP